MVSLNFRLVGVPLFKGVVRVKSDVLRFDYNALGSAVTDGPAIAGCLASGQASRGC